MVLLKCLVKCSWLPSFWWVWNHCFMIHVTRCQQFSIRMPIFGYTYMAAIPKVINLMILGNILGALWSLQNPFENVFQLDVKNACFGPRRMAVEHARNWPRWNPFRFRWFKTVVTGSWAGGWHDLPVHCMKNESKVALGFGKKTGPEIYYICNSDWRWLILFVGCQKKRIVVSWTFCGYSPWN